MPSLFNLIRTCIYGEDIVLRSQVIAEGEVGTVFLFTLICLAMAAHFQHVLAASDLSKFGVGFSSFTLLI